MSSWLPPASDESAGKETGEEPAPEAGEEPLLMHPAEMAVALLEEEVLALQSDRATKPGSVRWFELQGKGCALSMLRGMVAAGAHLNPEVAERYRRSIKVKGLEGAKGAKQPRDLSVEAADRY